MQKRISSFFKNKQGEYVIAQYPNWPLWLWIVLFSLRFIPLSSLQVFSYWSSSIVLLYWAYLEIVSGESLFRRFLGIVVASSSAYNLVLLLQGM